MINSAHTPDLTVALVVLAANGSFVTPLGQHIGKPDLKYVQFSYADETSALVQAGLSESFAQLYAEMTRAFNEGKVKPRDGRTPENTTPTRFDDFAEEFARAYHAV